MERTAKFSRKTKETDIFVSIGLDSNEESQIDSGIPFFDHMLNAMFRHGDMHVTITCKGDVEVDFHHSVEDIGICLGKVLEQALGNKAGIKRFGASSVPMDDSLTNVSIDISGRAYFKYTGMDLDLKIKDYDEELTLEFFRSFAVNSGINLHIQQLYGENRHHIHESIFKAAGVALKEAIEIDEKRKNVIPSTKGTIV